MRGIGAMRRSDTLPLHIGGFLGPFGGAVLSVIIPELQASFDVSRGAVASAIPAYLIPFALLQLVAGPIANRLGVGRVVRAGYVGYAIASLLAAAAPTFGVFLAARIAQGAANAFVTPLLLASLGEIVPKERLARSIGTFASVQTGALAASPLVGGLAGAFDWRIAFVVQAMVSLALALRRPVASTIARGAGGLRALLGRRLGLLCACGFAGYLGVTGIPVIVALRAHDAFGLGPSERGLVLAGFGLAGMLGGRPLGQVVDRAGRRFAAVLGSVACASAVAACGVVSASAGLAALWFAAGLGSVLMWNGLNTLAVEAAPANRTTFTSVFSACKFAGNAAAPVLWLPVYDSRVSLSFVAAGATCLLIIPLMAAYDSG